LHRHFKYVKKLSNEKFLDIRELDENVLTYYKIPRYIEETFNEFFVNVAKDIGKDSCAVNQEHPSVKVISEHSYSENKLKFESIDISMQIKKDEIYFQNNVKVVHACLSRRTSTPLVVY
jgi:hypothetical protein